MAKPQDRYVPQSEETLPLSRVAPSHRQGERVRVMEDGTDLSFVERLDYALNLVPQDEWHDRFGRSAKQLRRYLDGADVPFSVLTMVSTMTGVPIDWLAAGRPTYGQSAHDEWREELADPVHNPFPGSMLGPHPVDLRQVSDMADGIALREALTVDAADFRVPRPNPETPAGVPSVPKSFVVVPSYAVRASAGPGGFVEDEQLDGYIALDEAFVRHTLHRRIKDLVSIEATGDSMEPSIHDGDLLIIDTSVTDIQNTRIYVLDINGVLLVKRLSLRINGSVEVRSDNPKYSTETVTPNERNALRIIGQVIYQAGPVRS